MIRRLSAASLFAMALIALAAPAQAHLMNTGFGAFYDGLAHLFVTPEDVLPVIALALLAGLRGPRYGRGVLVALPLAWFGACGVGLLLSAAPPVPPVAVAAAIVVLGALAAADQPLPLGVLVGLALLIGLVNGAINGSELAAADAGGVVVVGIACAIVIVIALLGGQIATIRTASARVAVRVAGSWIAASGLLMLAWCLRAT
jgi:hydrogenase/urease accessory protein HupE